MFLELLGVVGQMQSGDPSIQECHSFRMIIWKAVQGGALARRLTGYVLSQKVSFDDQERPVKKGANKSEPRGCAHQQTLESFPQAAMPWWAGFD